MKLIRCFKTRSAVCLVNRSYPAGGFLPVHDEGPLLGTETVAVVRRLAPKQLFPIVTFSQIFFSVVPPETAHETLPFSRAISAAAGSVGSVERRNCSCPQHPSELPVDGRLPST